MKILIFSDKVDNYAELCGAAASLGGDICAFYAGNQASATTIAAQIVYFSDMSSEIMFEDFYETLKSVVVQENPDLIITTANKRCKYMSARIAAYLGTSVLTDLTNMQTDGSTIKGTQMYYGGAGIRTVRNIARAIVTVTAGVYEALSGKADEITAVPYVESTNKIKRIELKQKQGERINLAAAKKVIGVGRGFSSKESLSLATQLAKAIGAELGCSRPIAEGEGWMSTDRYIGVSGVMLKPDVYIAVGISGQIQHTIGINSAKTVIAINKDKNAPIFKQSDYGIVGDLNKILPALTALFS